MDSGASDMFLNNAKMLGVDLVQVDTMILSHGHYDHAGGILAFSKLNKEAKIYMKDSAGLDYYHLENGEERYIGIDKDILQLEQRVGVNGNLVIDDELFLFTDITGGRYPAKGNLLLKKKMNDGFVQDSSIMSNVLSLRRERNISCYPVVRIVVS